MNLKKISFKFEDIVFVEDISMQVLIKSIDKNDIVLALKQTGLDVVQKFLNNMSQNSADIINEEMEYLGPVRITEVEEAQKNIIQIMRELEQKGDIIIGTAGKGKKQII